MSLLVPFDSLTNKDKKQIKSILTLIDDENELRYIIAHTITICDVKYIALPYYYARTNFTNECKYLGSYLDTRIDVEDSIVLKEYQNAPYKIMKDYIDDDSKRCCTLKARTGFGKTVVSIKLSLNYTDGYIIILCNRIDILEQWSIVYNTFVEGMNVCLLSSNHLNKHVLSTMIDSHVIITTPHVLNKYVKPYIKNNISLLILDEVDSLLTHTQHKYITQLYPKRLLTLSATERDDILNELHQHMIGNNVVLSDLKKYKFRICKTSLEPNTTSLTINGRSFYNNNPFTVIQRFESALSTWNKRNELLLDLCFKYRSERGLRTILILKYIKHKDEMIKLLKKKYNVTHHHNTKELEYMNVNDYTISFFYKQKRKIVKSDIVIVTINKSGRGVDMSNLCIEDGVDFDIVLFGYLPSSPKLQIQCWGRARSINSEVVFILDNTWVHENRLKKKILPLIKERYKDELELIIDEV